MLELNSVHKQEREEQENKTIYESAACSASLASFVRRPVILIILLGLRRWDWFKSACHLIGRRWLAWVFQVIIIGLHVIGGVPYTRKRWALCVYTGYAYITRHMEVSFFPVVHCTLWADEILADSSYQTLQHNICSLKPFISAGRWCLFLSHICTVWFQLITW